ncbi:MAG: 3-oxoacyl-[acyl-carrier-protein] reductase [Clostridia bacterium]|nr:3-oxoacyl-[acyl-carrier-protein] reductase [Clostridia bacterium]
MSEKVAVVTGGTTGIGKEIALTLAQDGFDVVVNYLQLDETVKQEIEAMGRKCLLIEGNVTSMDDMEKMTKAIMDEFGRIDVLVNNAGITRDTLLLRMTEEDFDSVLNVNTKGAFCTMKNIVPIMMKQKGGRIINISSVVGVVGNAGQVNYSASKAAVIGMTKSLAKEVASRGILVNAVAPGFIATRMTDKLNDTQKENILAQIPLKRMGAPKDIANAVAFLASDRASYITGHTLVVDGGMICD